MIPGTAGLRMPMAASRPMIARLATLYRLRKGRALLKHDEPYGIIWKIHHNPMAARPAGVEPAPMEQHDFQIDRLALKQMR